MDRGVVICVRSQAYPTQKRSTIVVVKKKWQGSSCGVCKAGFAGDGAVGHDSGMCKVVYVSKFFGVKRTNAMEVNDHVHWQSTVTSRMASFQSTPDFFAASATLLPITVFFFRTVFSIKVIVTGTGFISQSANSDFVFLTVTFFYSSEFSR